MWITSPSGATVRAVDPAEPRLLTVSHGAPSIHLFNLRLLGTLRIEGGHLTATNCSIEAIHHDAQGGVAASSERAISIVGGHAALLQTILLGHLAGAIKVVAAHLTLVHCEIRDSRAESGSAILVGHSAEVDVALSLFADNSARLTGGALQATQSLESLAILLPDYSATHNISRHCALVECAPLLMLRRWTVEQSTSATRRSSSATLQTATLANRSISARLARSITRSPHRLDDGSSSGRASRSTWMPEARTPTSLTHAHRALWAVLRPRSSRDRNVQRCGASSNAKACHDLTSSTPTPPYNCCAAVQRGACARLRRQRPATARRAIS